MLELFQSSSPWLTALLWIAGAALAAVAIWTVVRAPGRRQDPGLDRNLPEDRKDDEDGGDVR